MNKHELVCILAAGISAAAYSAAPRVDQESVLLSQAADRTVTVSYVLTGGPGVVTVDFQTNCVTEAGTVWASVGSENFQHVGGDVNCLVTETGVRKTIAWRPNLVGADYQINDGFRAVVKAWSLEAPPEYLAINLGVDRHVRFFADVGAVPFGVTDERYKTDWLLMRKIPAANVVWRMGSPRRTSMRPSMRRRASSISRSSPQTAVPAGIGWCRSWSRGTPCAARVRRAVRANGRGSRP